MTDPKVGDVVEATVTGYVYDVTPGGVVYMQADSGARVTFGPDCGATYAPAALKVKPRDVWSDIGSDLWVVGSDGKMRMIGGNGKYLLTEGEDPAEVNLRWGPLTLLVRDGKPVDA